MKTDTLSFSTANGDTTAFVAMPDEANGKAVILIQEWWGLNDHIKDIAGRYAGEGFTAIAPDLYRGQLATNPEEAGKMMNALAIEDGLDTIKNALDTTREKYGFQHYRCHGFLYGRNLRASRRLPTRRHQCRRAFLRRYSAGGYSKKSDRADGFYFGDERRLDQHRKSRKSGRSRRKIRIAD